MPRIKITANETVCYQRYAHVTDAQLEDLREIVQQDCCLEDLMLDSLSHAVEGMGVEAGDATEIR